MNLEFRTSIVEWLEIKTNFVMLYEHRHANGVTELSRGEMGVGDGGVSTEHCGGESPTSEMPHLFDN